MYLSNITKKKISKSLGVDIITIIEKSTNLFEKVLKENIDLLISYLTQDDLVRCITKIKNVYQSLQKALTNNCSYDKLLESTLYNKDVQKLFLQFRELCVVVGRSNSLTELSYDQLIKYLQVNSNFDIFKL